MLSYEKRLLMNIYDRVCSDVYKHHYPEAIIGMLEDMDDWTAKSPEQSLEAKIQTENQDWNGSANILLIDIERVHQVLSPALKSILYFSPNQNIHIKITAIKGKNWTGKVKYQVQFEIYTYEQIPETIISSLNGWAYFGSLITLPADLVSYTDTIAKIRTYETTPNGTKISGLLIDKTKA